MIQYSVLVAINCQGVAFSCIQQGTKFSIDLTFTPRVRHVILIPELLKLKAG